MDFSQFKKNRSKINESVKKLKSQKPSYADDRFWSLIVDKDYNGEALIRFLPQKDPSLPPVELYFNHSFSKGNTNKKWFFENCPQTLGKECPICEYVQPFWDEDTKESRGKAFNYGRKKNYIANILVVKDPQKPENNGKVFLFRFGTKIYEKIMEKLAPESELIDPVMIHDLWEGRNFRISSKKVESYRNYDASAFLDKETPVAKSDEAIGKIFEQIHDLAEFTDEKKFKEYDEIKKKFNGFMGIEDTEETVSHEEKFDFGDGEEGTDKEKDSTPDPEPEKKSEPAEEKAEPEKEDSEPEKEDSEEDDFNFDDGDDDFNFDFGDDD